MKMNIMIFKLVLMVFVGIVISEEITLINFGVADGEFPSIGKKFERSLNTRLSTVDGMVLMDINKTKHLKKRAGFIDQPVLSRKLVNILRENSDEKSIVVCFNDFVCGCVPGGCDQHRLR